MCTSGGARVLPDATTWRCAARGCGGAFSFAELHVPPPDALPSVTMGEGNTPLLSVDLDGRSVTAKAEFDSPTSSFKDRGAAMLVAAALDAGATQLVADSSGNAGVAIATYAGHAGLPCEVFVAASTAQVKVERIRATGAVVQLVEGSREDVAAAAIGRVESSGAYYASHVWNPWFLEGTKHYVYELVEQLGRWPRLLVLPAGNGTLVLGAWRAFQELEHTIPIIAVQASACAPIARAFTLGRDHVDPVANEGTRAAGIAIAAPVRGDEILAAVRASGGTFVTVTDDELVAAQDLLARAGYNVEPTAAAPAAAARGINDDLVLPIASRT